MESPFFEILVHGFLSRQGSENPEMSNVEAVVEARTTFETYDCAELIDIEDRPKTQYISSLEIIVSELDQPKIQRNQPNTAMKAIFINQASLSMPGGSKTVEKDPLLISEASYAKQKQISSKTMTDVWEPGLPSSQNSVHEICSENPLAVQHPSSQSIKTFDSLSSSKQFTLKRIILKRCKLKSSVDKGVAEPGTPESTFKRSEHTEVSQQKFMDRISLARTAPEKTLSNNVTSSSQSPTIVSLISVKRTLIKSTKSIKKILPKMSLPRNFPKQHAQEKPLKKQVTLKKITPKKDPEAKKASSKKHPTSKIGSKEETIAKTKTLMQRSKNKVSLKKAAPEKVKKPQKCLKSKDSSPKVAKLMPLSQKPEDLTVNLTIPCYECGKVFGSYRSLARHFRCHKKPLLYSCDHCPKTFKMRSNLMSHANVHRKEGRYACSECPAKFTWRNTYRTHVLSHEKRLGYPLTCLVCAKKFSYQKAWDQHVTVGGCSKSDKLSKQTAYQCDICQRFATTRGNLKKHLAMHQGLKPFLCDTCGARFTAQTSLNEHVTRHSGKRPYVCHICGKSFTQSSGFRQHLAIHNRADQFVCEFCMKGFKLNRYLVKHIETMHVNEKKYNCHVCGKLFKLGDYLRRHMKAVHPEAEYSSNVQHKRTLTTEPNGLGHAAEEECGDPTSGGEFCEYSEAESKAEYSIEVIDDDFLQNTADDEVYSEGASEMNVKGTEGTGIANVVEKIPIGSESSTVSENVGGEVFERMYDGCTIEVWDQEMLTKFCPTGSGNEVLQMCEATLEDEVEAPTGEPEGLPAGLQQEFVAPEADAAIWPIKRRPVKRTTVRPFPCLVCTKSFSKQTTLDSHMGSHSEKRPVECDVCQHRFNTKQEVGRHLQSHGANSADNLRCSACGKVHLRLIDRKRHICGFMHTFACKMCEEVFQRPKLLYRHVRDQHKASLECKICGKQSTTTSNLKKHMVVHTGDKPFVCEVCGARFTANQSLKAHAGLHEGQRPYVCSICAKSFAQKSSMTQHEMLHDQEPRYACTHCDKKFKVVSYLRRHIAVLHTAEKRFGCTDCGKRYGLRSALAIHVLSHRERRRFQCEDCDKTFSDKRYMEKHARKEHGVDLQ